MANLQHKAGLGNAFVQWGAEDPQSIAYISFFKLFWHVSQFIKFFKLLFAYWQDGLNLLKIILVFFFCFSCSD